MKGMDLALYLGLPMMIGGLIAWMIAAELAKSWLKKNDPYYEPPSKVVQLFIGGLFTAIGPVRQYARQRRARNEPTTVSTVFWSGLAVSWTGLAVFIILLITSVN